MPSIQEIKAIIAAVLLFAAAAGGFTVAKRLDAASYARLQLAQTQKANADLAAALAKQRAYDQAAIQAAQTEAQRQAAIARAALDRKQEVQVHVITRYISAKCVPYGFIRVLDAAALNAGAGTLSLPTGKSDDTCAPITWDDLANAIIDNYTLAHENAEQLNSLIAFIRQMEAMQK